MKLFFERLKENKLFLITAIVLITIIIVTEVLIVFYLKYEINSIDLKEKNVVEEIVEETEIKNIYVEIKGEIIKPGVYKIKDDNRVVDVIKLAGGLTKKADTRTINLSKKLVDEMVIVIYSNEQTNKLLKEKENEQLLSDACVKDSFTINNACIKQDEAISNKLISINKASLEELMTLPGIGQAKAQSIIDYRKQSVFEVTEDIKKVTGIGEALYAQIKEFITT